MRNAIAVNGIMAAWLSLVAGYAVAEPVTISADTTWSGEKTIDSGITVIKGTVTVEPGAKITFKPGGNINVREGAVLTARGTEAKPIDFIGGDKAGTILTGGGATVELERCRLSNMCGEFGGSQYLMYAINEKIRITVRKCTFTDCTGMRLATDDGAIEMSGCDIRRKAGLFDGDAGRWWFGGNKGTKITIADNTIQGVPLYYCGNDAEVSIAGNALVSSTLGNWGGTRVTIEGNYLHNPLLNGSFGLLNAFATIRGNIFRGGTWTMSNDGGTITGNVIETLSPEEVKKSAEAGFKDSGTHENFNAIGNDSVIERNIVINPSLGAFMTAQAGVGAQTLVRNNTFDLRGGTAPFWLNHLVTKDPKNMVVRNNLFLRTGRICAERDIPDSISYVDYNLWAGTAIMSPGVGSEFTSKRFVRITIKGKKEGDDGFGAHDVFAPTADDKAFDPKKIVEDPDFVLPYSDDDMLTRKHTPRECLELYRKAYSLTKGSPAIGAGSSADAKDVEVKDGKCDIGALEYVAK
jgi:hypothetical protein